MKALLGSMGGGLLLATMGVRMGLRRLERLQGVTFSRIQKRRAWWIIFGVFTAFGFFAMSLTQR